MSRYVVIESHDPFEADLSAEFFDLALSLSGAGHDVAVLFVADGIRAALAGRHSFWLAELRRAGVVVLADLNALLAAGFVPAHLAAGVKATPAGIALDDLLQGRKRLWVTDTSVRRAA
jgi:intracellular sulfur oxidation DsrE/DsrF family protein